MGLAETASGQTPLAQAGRGPVETPPRPGPGEPGAFPAAGCRRTGALRVTSRPELGHSAFQDDEHPHATTKLARTRGGGHAYDLPALLPELIKVLVNPGALLGGEGALEIPHSLVIGLYDFAPIHSQREVLPLLHIPPGWSQSPPRTSLA